MFRDNEVVRSRTPSWSITTGGLWARRLTVSKCN